MFQKLRARTVLIFMLLAVSMNSHSAFHMVQINEVYSNASGTVQFIELTMLSGGQTFFSGQTISSAQGGSIKSYMFPTNLSRGVAGAKVLIGTTGYAALAGVPAPDYIVQNGFVFTSNLTINFAGVDFVSFPSVPTDGTLSIDRNLATATNTPTNNAGATGTVVLPSPGTAPAAPTIGTAVPGSGQATVAFAPGTDGGSPITGFTVTCTAAGQTTRSATGGASPITVTLLTNGTTYSCSVTATNANGTGLASGPVNVIPAVPASASITLASSANVAGYGAPVTLIASAAGSGLTGTVAFSVSTSSGARPLPACGSVPLVAGAASCSVPGSFQNQNPRIYVAAYSGDANNQASSVSFSQVVAVNSAVLSVAAYPLPPIVSGRTTALTALVKMGSPVGTVTFSDNGVAVAGCAQVALGGVPDSTDSAVATCTVTAPTVTSGVKQYVATYFYPTGHISGRISEQATFDLRVVAQGPADFTDMWWAGSAENGWGVSISQHGPIQFNVIFAYDSAGKSLWYVMPGGSFNAAGTVFTGSLYLPNSSPFSAYDKTKFVVGAPIGTATITYANNSTATLAYTINGISATKSIQRQVFSAEITGPNLRTNDLWWATSAEDGWGLNIAQQGRVLFPVWYTYDAAGKATFFTAQGGSWSGTVWSGTVYAHTSAAWLGVAYNGSQFTANIVGTISLDFSDASNAMMTYTVNGFTQVKRIERQPY